MMATTMAPRTMPRHPSRLVVTGLAVVLATLALVACGGGSDPADPKGGAEYVALGDSDAAGAGIDPISDIGCMRSKANYPSLVAKKMGYKSFEDATCAGAETIHLLRPQFTRSASNDPQLDSVGSRTKLVTLTIGLNDQKVAYGLLGACVELPDGEVPPLCRPVLEATQQAVDKQLAGAAGRVKESLELIKEQAPNARIILVGYPRYFPDSGSCPDRIPMQEEMVPRTRDALADVNKRWKAVAERVGVDYVDTYALSKGHDVCSDDPWLNGSADDPGEAAALHPFAAFHRAAANAIVKLLKKQ
jgi:lysophospholipase L1-like esterase